MARFHIEDVEQLENAPTSPAALRTKIGKMILHSTAARAKVDSIDPKTGEYRVVLQGTLDRVEGKFEEK